jgi:hypothetical protein
MKYDACGLCGGNNSTCAGCDGIVNSGKVYPLSLLSPSPSPPPYLNFLLDQSRNDVCGVCGGDSKCISKKPTFTNNNVVLYVVWGVEGIDRSNADINDPFSEYLFVFLVQKYNIYIYLYIQY